DQLFLSNTIMTFGDNLGDRRLIFSLQSVSSYIDYQAAYIDLSSRLQKGLQAYYESYYYTVFNESTGTIQRTRNPYRFIGGNAFGVSAQPVLPARGKPRLRLPQVRLLPALGQRRPGERHPLHPVPEQLSALRRQAGRRHDAVPGLRPDLRTAPLDRP